MNSDTRILPKWQAGQPISAGRLNDVQELIQEVTHGPRSVPDGLPRIIWVRLKEWIGPAEDFVDRDGVIQYYDDADDKWKDTDPEQEVKVSDLTGKLCYPKDSIVPCLAHRSGKLVPLSGNATTLLCKATTGLSAGSISSGFIVCLGTPTSPVDAELATLPTIELGVGIDDDKVFYANWTGVCWLGVPWECNG